MKIEVKNLTKEINEKEILKDINMSFYSGNIYCLLGPNGSGKSMFLKLLCGVDDPTSGEILFNGKSIDNVNFFTNTFRRLIEKAEFFSNLTGYENLKLSAFLQKDITDDDILIALKKVGLDEAKDIKFKEYSFGMRQRLMIAKVLMNDSKIIILDDPFNGIDQNIKDYLISVLKNARAKDRLVIISTTNDIEVKRLADITYHLSDGKLYWI